MKLPCVATLMCAVLCLTVSRSESAIVIQPDETASKDTFAYSGAGLTNINFDGTNSTPLGPPGSPTVGQVYGIYLGASATSGAAHDTRSLIQFDLPALAGLTPGQVSSARLRLFSVPTPGAFPGSEAPSGAFPVTLSISEPGASWTETTATWANQPGSGSAVTSTIVNGTGQYFDFNVTSLVQGWLNGNPNLGMLLSQDAEVTNTGSGNSVGALFNSSFASGNRPILEVTAVPEPGSALLAGVVGAMGCPLVRRLRRRQS